MLSRDDRDWPGNACQGVLRETLDERFDQRRLAGARRTDDGDDDWRFCIGRSVDKRHMELLLIDIGRSPRKLLRPSTDGESFRVLLGGLVLLCLSLLLVRRGSGVLIAMGPICLLFHDFQMLLNPLR